jgi:hypothetical protein
MSKVDARGPGRRKTVDIVGSCKTSGNSAGQNVKGFPCNKIG